jgi:hypothetical protein
LGRSDILVTQQFLDFPQIHTGLKEARGKRVAQLMRVARCAACPEPAVKDVRDSAVRDGVSHAIVNDGGIGIPMARC